MTTKTAGPKLCRQVVDGARCRYELVQGSNTYCYWHRLMRVRMEAQQRAALVRLQAALDTPGAQRRERVSPVEWPPGERWCAGCQSFVPLFYCTTSRCRACTSKARADAHRQVTYNLGADEYEQILELQDGRCAICRKGQTMRSLAVDHNHKTGAVRGALCKRCNHDLLGAAFESVRVLLAAAVYLATPPARGDWVSPEICGDAIYRAFIAAVEDQLKLARARERTTDATGTG